VCARDPAHTNGTRPIPKIPPVGYIAEKDYNGNPTGTQTPIYRGEGVTEEQAATAAANIIAGYDLLNSGQKGTLAGKIKAIRIIQEAVAANGNGSANRYEYEVVGNQVILKIQHNHLGSATAVFSSFIRNDLPELELIPPVGYIAEKDYNGNPTGTQTPIYRGEGVTEEQAATAAANIIAGYNLLSSGTKGQLAGKIKAIWIVAGASDFDTTGEQRNVYISITETAVGISEILRYDFIPTLQDA